MFPALVFLQCSCMTIEILGYLLRLTIKPHDFIPRLPIQSLNKNLLYQLYNCCMCWVQSLETLNRHKKVMKLLQYKKDLSKALLSHH